MLPIHSTELDVLAFEHHIEAAVAKLLQAAGCDDIITAETSDEAQASSAVEILFEPGGATNQGRIDVGGLEYDAYEGDLSITLRTQVVGQLDYPAVTPANLRLFGTYASRVRAALREQRACPDLGGNLTTAYAVREIQPAGTQRDHDPDFFQDILRLRFRLTLVIQPEAWPAIQ